MHVVRSLPRCKFFCKWHLDAQNGRRSQPSAAASIEDDLGVSPVPPTGGVAGAALHTPLSAAALHTPQPPRAIGLDRLTGGWVEGVRTKN